MAANGVQCSQQGAAALAGFDATPLVDRGDFRHARVVPFRSGHIAHSDNLSLFGRPELRDKPMWKVARAILMSGADRVAAPTKRPQRGGTLRNLPATPGGQLSV